MRHFLQGITEYLRPNRNPPASDPPDYSQVTTGTADIAAVHSNSLGYCLIGFGVDLYQQLAPVSSVSNCKQGTSASTDIDSVARDNIVFSPFAVAAALSMTLAGARSATATELASALHVGEGSHIHDLFTAELAQIASRALRVTFRVSNQLYVDQRFSVHEGYLSFLRGTYGEGAVRTVDFACCHEAVRTDANKCVAHETADRVQELLEQGSVSPATVLMLVSATYFIGAWESPFQPAFTGPDEFHVDAQTVVIVDMMNQMRTFRTGHSAELQATALEMPHQGGKTCMTLILPDEMDGLPLLEKSLNARRLSQLLRNLAEKPNVMLKLPKFVVQQRYRLRRALKALGVHQLFTPRANLSGIFQTGSPALAEVFHGAFLEVNEAGAESPVPMMDDVVGGGPGIGNITHFVVNRPFIFLVGPCRSNVVFLMGSVRRP